ncbi:MAG: PilZ domain-containing protein [Acidobacteria bacterium]|nr:MAG: PilZ domain-containing protein [Acidobacteriota bacterium]
MSPRGQEQRKHDRVSRPLTLRTISSEYGTIEMEISNLSLGGAYCLSTREIPAMTQLRLNIFLPSTDGHAARLHFPIDVEAVVVRAEDVNGHDGDPAWRLALFFSRMATQDREVLARYLSSVTDS